MKASERTDIDWSQFEYVNENGSTLITPCVGFSLFLEVVDPDGVLDFLERSQKALGDHLKFYQSDTMKKKGKITKRALTAVPTWLKNLRRNNFSFEFSGVQDYHSSSPAMIDIYMNYRERLPGSDEDLKRLLEHYRLVYDTRGFNASGFANAALYVTLPLDHDLSDPEAMLDWVMGFKLVKERDFLAGNCGYGLNYRWAVAPEQDRMAGPGMRYPGFLVYKGPGLYRLFEYNPEQNALTRYVTRVNWLTLLSQQCVDRLGGMSALEQQADEDIKMHRVEHGMVVQAGLRPEIGDVGHFNLVPAYRKAAKIIRPVRVKQLDASQEWLKEWLEAFDKSYE